MGCCVVSTLSPNSRDLAALPKAQLHLHFGQATIRRDTLNAWLTSLEQDQLEAMQAAATAEIEAATDDPNRAAKYRRRLQMVTPPLDIGKCSAVFESPAELEAMDAMYAIEVLQKKLHELLNQVACWQLQLF